MVNPHLSGAQSRNTVYGSNAVLERGAGPRHHEFLSVVGHDFRTHRYGTATPVTVAKAERVFEPDLLTEAATLVPN